MTRLLATPAEYVFWACLFLTVYTYLLYPVFLFAFYSLVQVQRDLQYLCGRRDRRASPRERDDLPAVSLIIAAYNEESRLKEKIANLKGLDYPPEKLEVVFVSDGSTDGTNEILRSLEGPNTQTILLTARGGKPNALNHGVARSRNSILVFSDASTLFAPDALKNLVRHFTNPQVGIVCGSLQFQGTAESRQTEGVYWKYESMLRFMEARIGATLTASGAIYALRRVCYRDLPPDTLIEDFVIPMNVRQLGYRVVYDPEASAIEFAASSVAGEFTRRVRLAVGSFKALGKFLRIRLHGLVAWAFLSHKFLRWVLPFILIALLASNTLLWERDLYKIALTGQLLFYLWATAGFVLRDRVRGIRYALLGYFLVAIHIAYLVGLIRLLTSRGEITWQRVN